MSSIPLADVIGIFVQWILKNILLSTESQRLKDALLNFIHNENLFHNIESQKCLHGRPRFKSVVRYFMGDHLLDIQFAILQ